MTLMLAIVTHAVALSMDFSQSLASMRHRPNQPNVRSTTHLRGRAWKPLAASDRLRLFVHGPCAADDQCAAELIAFVAAVGEDMA
ncbi:hypothetical protein SIAM614_00662 [Stappia aggregata IAM 12614]|uniref:Uncharacterized protein n=1 Tax=Roseibium aggregatum (strain ATCC 25650 / DSM 13394 / JCM 20685 / NBRC 16684 / NCIMB 2208 / IAM 12614 / B1) TaxID=384765 RepID=A0P2Q5_ROSAI|nr:hypothetical protein SIAM614_00085 [Stappia aggregata IAM 12614] [Roseibium aggregatum IAM 12614]EAV40708.1 hypothetical protein SIAM614_00662 [Stappia aggregata IAM 12614] [Roseibium aggregatum IAM 12614]